MSDDVRRVYMRIHTAELFRAIRGPLRVHKNRKVWRKPRTWCGVIKIKNGQIRDIEFFDKTGLAYGSYSWKDGSTGLGEKRPAVDSIVFI